MHTTIGVGLRTVASGIIEFAERYPQLSVELSIGTDPINLIGNGIDLLIRSADFKDASIESRILVPVHYHVVATPEYFAKHGRPETPHDLATHNCLIHTGRRTPNDWPFTGPEGPYSVRVSGNFATNSGAALHEAALRGMGIAHLPDYTSRDDLASGRLESVLEGLNSSDRCIRAYYPRTRYPQPKVTLLVEHLEHYMQAQMAAETKAAGAA